MKKKATMHETFKTAIFGNVTDKENAQPPIVKIINNHLVINNDFCDLRTIKNRYNPDTKELSPSGVDNILYVESILTLNYGKQIDGKYTLYDFITVDCSGGNDFDPDVKKIKDLLC